MKNEGFTPSAPLFLLQNTKPMLYYKEPPLTSPIMADSSDRILTEDEQIALGKPSKIEQLNASQVQTYLEFLQGLLSEEKIHVVTPSTLINQATYESLNELQQGRVDQAAGVLAGYIRTLRDLLDRGDHDTFQTEYYVQMIWKYKDKYELELGDIFII